MIRPTDLPLEENKALFFGAFFFFSFLFPIGHSRPLALGYNWALIGQALSYPGAGDPTPFSHFSKAAMLPPLAPRLDDDFELLSGSRAGDTERVLALAARSPQSARCVDSMGRNALSLVAERDSLAGVKALFPISDVDRRDNFGLSCLDVAAQTGAKASVEFFLSQRPDLALDLPEKSWPPLMWAARNGYLRCVRLLMPFSDVSVRRDNSESGEPADTAIFMAASWDHWLCVELLAPACDLSLRDTEGHTLLMRLAERGDPLTAQLIRRLILPRSDSSAANPSGETALDIALRLFVRTPSRKPEQDAIIESLAQAASESVVRSAAAKNPSALDASPAFRARFEFFELRASFPTLMSSAFGADTKEESHKDKIRSGANRETPPRNRRPPRVL